MNKREHFLAIASLSAVATMALAFQNLYMVIDLSAGIDASKYPVSFLDSEPPDGWSDEYKGDKLVLRRVEAGTFDMGSPEDEVGREYRSPKGSETLHEVTLSKSFYIGVFEVTQRQYELITGRKQAYYKGDFRPVDCISYSSIRGSAKGSSFPEHAGVDADSFLGILRSKTGINFDLPTEAQWEYACRAGTATALNNGRNLENYADSYYLSRLGRYSLNQYDGKGGYVGGTTTVGSYEPNRWGLYDMHGNVAEWCLDWWAVFTDDATVDPVGPTTGEWRVARGGFFGGTYYCYGVAASARAAFRSNKFLIAITPDSSLPYYGFRLALTTDD